VEFTSSFLLTYRFFTTPLTFLNCLKARYLASTPSKNDATTTEEQETIQQLVRVRVTQVLIRWVKSRVSSYDFDDPDSELNKQTLEFVEEIKPNLYASSSALSAIEQRLKRKPGHNEPLSPLSPLASQQSYTTVRVPSIPNLAPSLDFSLMEEDAQLDIRNFEVGTIAEYLTAIDFEYFRRIHPCEFLKQGWSNVNSAQLAPNILSMTGRFNDIGNWVVFEVLNGSTHKDRVQIILHFVQVAKTLQRMNNFNGMCAVISGLNNSSVTRLKRTFTRLAKKEKNTGGDEMTKLAQGEDNFRSLRELWSNVEPPAIPFLAITLKDLTFLEDGNPDLLEDGGINFYKWRKIAEVIQEVLEYQHLPYTPVINQVLQSYIQSKAEQAKELGTHGLYKLSKRCEF